MSIKTLEGLIDMTIGDLEYYSDSYSWKYVERVPGGWIYHRHHDGNVTSVFVPLPEGGKE